MEPSAATLAGISDERFVDLMPRLSGLDLRTHSHHDPLGGITAFSLVLDDQPAYAVAAGQGGDVDLLIGANLDEGALYLAPVGLLTGSTDADVHATAARFHPDPDAAILGDGLFGTGTRKLTEAHAKHGPTWAYVFVWRSAAVDGRLGASHVMELPFVFDQLHLPALHGPQALLGDVAPPSELAARPTGAASCAHVATMSTCPDIP